MRSLRSALLAALVLAAPAAAQKKEPFTPIIDVRYPVSQRAAYMAALDAIEARGLTTRVRLLDDGILTQPEFATNSGPDATAIVMAVELSREGDSTRVVIRAQVVRPDGRPAPDSDERMGRILVAQSMVFSAIDSVAEKLRPAREADPREEGDAYGYGRQNPVRTGGGMESGAANQRRWLEGLRGPGGEAVRYRRLGSCGQFPSEHGYQGTAALDAYEVTYDGLERPVILYMDLYTPPQGALAAPEGFVLASAASPA